jgi:hypothetical protein
MEQIHQKYVLVETIISAVINAVVSALFVWIVFHGLKNVVMWGPNGLAFDLVPTTFMITLMTCIALTLVTRKRMRKGIVPHLSGPRVFQLPKNAILRGLTMAVVATVLLVPATVGILIAANAAPMAYGHVMIYKIVYGALLGLVVTPVILINALKDMP